MIRAGLITGEEAAGFLKKTPEDLRALLSEKHEKPDEQEKITL